MVMKVCTVIELANTWPKLESKFSNGRRFHGNRLIKLTKKCGNASFPESLMNEMLLLMFQVGQGIPRISPQVLYVSTWKRGQFFVFSFFTCNKKGPIKECARFH